jgi:exopolysaccharide production protein ExoY
MGKPILFPVISGIRNKMVPFEARKSSASNLDGRQGNFIAKSSFDFSLAIVAIFFLLPLLALIVTILLATQGRPVLIRHRRIGRGGKSFPCFKFRTMVTDGDEVLRKHLSLIPEAREEWNATRKLKSDPRVTPVGAVLRKSSIDELPQLLNILRGEMSLVGPRPIVQDEAVHYGDDFEEYTRVRPGLTGLWQISGRNDVSYQARVRMDVNYVSQRTFTGDLVILAKTVPAVLRSRGCY